MKLEESLEKRLLELGQRLLNQHAAKTLIAPLGNSFGFWFGGGNICLQDNGNILITGRFRNEGDARTGTGAGARGLECAVFVAESPTDDFQKVLSLSKKDLSHTEEVVSIEGASLNPDSKRNTVIVFKISTEKKYP